MSNHSYKWRALLPLAAVALGVVPGFASPIPVVNNLFETLPVGGLNVGCGSGCTFASKPIPGWTNSGVSGQFRPGVPGNTTSYNSLPNAPTIAFSNGPIISQIVAPTVQLGEVYTLQVDIGHRKGFNFTGTVDLLVNGVTYVGVGVLPASGTFGTYTATYTGLSADVGKSITIQLRSSGPQANFDSVRLDGTAGPTSAPEPASFLLLGPALFLVLKARGRLRASV